MNKAVILAFALAGSLSMVSFAGAETNQVADAKDMAPAEELSDEGLTPVGPQEICEGSYAIDVDCSSSMFPIDECLLTVKDGAMTADLTLGGQGYLYVYPGTAEEAAKAPAEELISFESDELDRQVYTVPVECLNKTLPLASFSKRKQQWYDRTVIYRADRIPADALLTEQIDLQSLGLEDGRYTVSALLDGAKGKTALLDPALLTVEDGKALLTISFNTDNYDYLEIEGEKVLWDGEGDYSTFTFPVDVFDRAIPVGADSTALGKNTLLSYAITLDSDSIQAE